MEFLTHLWLPIILSAAAVWVASAIVWMALPHHKDDFSRPPDEAALIAFIKSSSIPAGNYGFPHCEHRSQMKDPEFQKRMSEGPMGVLSVWPKMNMGRNMLLSFVVYLVVSILIAYVGWAALPHGITKFPPNPAPGSGGVLTGDRASFGHIMQVLGTVGVLAYSFAFLPNGIWFGQYKRALLMNMIDGVAYGLITGAVFAALWPS